LFPVDCDGMSNLISDFLPLANTELAKIVVKAIIAKHINSLRIDPPLIFQWWSMQNKYQKNKYLLEQIQISSVYRGS